MYNSCMPTILLYYYYYSSAISISKLREISVSFHYFHNSHPSQDGYRVLTCSKDFSIRVYSWVKEGGAKPSYKLSSRYQLLGGSIALKTQLVPAYMLCVHTHIRLHEDFFFITLSNIWHFVHIT